MLHRIGLSKTDLTEKKYANSAEKCKLNCCVKYCTEPFYAGGHVLIDSKWWLVPVGQTPKCKHNLPSSSEEFTACAGTIAVRETRGDTLTHLKTAWENFLA